MKKLLTLVFLLIFVSWVKAETLSLEKCVELGKKNNPDFKISKYQMNQSRNNYYNSYSNFIPYLQASFNKSKETSGPTLTSLVDPNTGVPLESKKVSYDFHSGGLYTGVTLFNLNYFFNIRATKAYFNAMKYSHKQAMLDLELSIKTKYYNVLTYHKLLEASIESINRSRKQLEKIDQMYQLGLKAKLDVVKQKGLLGQAVLDSISYGKNYQNSLGELNEIIGNSPDEDISIVDVLDSNYIDLDYTTLLNFAKEKHPLLKSYINSLKSQKYGLLGNWSNYMPTVNMGFSHTWRNRDFGEVSNFFDKDYSRSLYFRFSWNIFDGFSREMRLKNKKLDYNIAKENLKKTELSLIQDIKSSYLSAMEAKEKIEVNRINFESATQEYELAQEKYNLGSGSYLDLLDAQVTLTQTQGQLIGSLYEYKISLAQLENKTSFRFNQ